MDPSPGNYTLRLTLCLLLLTLAQGLRAQVDTTSLIVDSMAVDTTMAGPDSSAVEPKVVVMPMSSGALEEEVQYTAQDSIVYDIVNKKVYLYGLAVIDYQDLHLEAEEIVIDWTKNELKAYSKMDSLRRKVKEQLKMSDKGREGEADSIAYNFKSKKGKIYNFRTMEGNGYVHVEAAKKDANNVMYASNAKYTTCDRKEPHFWLQLNKAKIIPSDKVVTSYAYVVIEDIPLYPVAVPFGFFPTNTSEASSGILFPKYGFSQGRGYFLNDGGYYFALSDKMDLALTGDIFSYGSWGLSGESNYKKRYKYSGSGKIDFNKNFYDNGLGEFEPQDEFKVAWTHRQDPKSIPGMTFSSNVNAGTSNFNRNNSLNNDEILNSRLRSSINFSKAFGGTPFRTTVALNHDQNIQSKTINLSLPTTNLSMDRINPFEGLRNKWLLFLRNLGFSHTLNFENRLSTFDSLLFKPDDGIELEWDRGISHRLPVNTTFKVLKWISVNPSFNYRGYYNFYEDRKFLNDTGVVETVRNGANSYAYDYNFSTTLNTTLYGMFRFKRSKSLVALRHAMVPSINFNYTPDFTTERWDYFREVPTSLEPNEDGDLPTQRYNRFSSNPLGAPQAGKTGAIGFGLENIWELKLKDKKDTLNENATKKVKVIESLNINGNYNFFADSLNLSDIRINGRTTLFKSLAITTGLVLDPYAIDETGKNYNEYLWDTEGKLAAVQTFSFNAGMSVRRAIFENLFKKTKPKEPRVYGSPYSAYYARYSFPFDLRISYDYSLRRNIDQYDPTQTISFTGSFEPTDKWRTQYTINYDLANNEIGYTNLKFVRDLHCWEFSFDWTPTGLRKGFFFSLRARAAELQSLKLDKRSNFWDR